MSDNFNFTSLGHMGSPQHVSHVRASSSASTDVDGGGLNGAQDNLLPIANVGRIMKDVLPPQAKISKHAKETIQECATEFVGFVTGEASERCRQERRKTINGDDICHAMRNLGLDHYADAMRGYLRRYRESEEVAAALNNNSGREIQIDVRDELSIFRSNEQRQGRN